ncbi:SDR family NAD(P)-dependent oxidoreductase [Salana multivorans]
MTGRLEGRTALVVGANGSIGRAIARALGAAGARLVLAARDTGRLDRLAAELEVIDVVSRVVGVDVADDDALAAAVKVAATEGMDIAVNNAGATHRPAPLGELSMADADRVLTVTLRGTLAAMRHELAARLPRRVVHHRRHPHRRRRQGRPGGVTRPFQIPGATTMNEKTPYAPPAAAQLQYVHLEKLYGYLPGLTESLPAIFGVSPQEYGAIRDRFDALARSAAQELLVDDGFAGHVSRLPFQRGARILAVGDSVTDDLQSWAEILRHVLAIARPDDDLTVVNAGLSAHTTAMILRRWPSLLNPAPDWIVCGLGGNDVTRIAGGKPQVTLTESIENLRELRGIAAERTTARWTWLTPVPVDEERAATNPGFQYGASSWRNTDITALADAIRGFDEPVVDLVDVFGIPAHPDLQGPDGVHPSLTGQQAIVTAVVTTLR